MDEDEPVEEAGPYILRSFLADIPLSADPEDSASVEITCVELWNGNLYIGTSLAELLHFVQIPPEPSDSSAQPVYILASRLQPPFAGTNSVGVQQVLILSNVNKACVLCNGTLTFYSLPELSPAFGPTQVKGVNYVGGLDLNIEDEGLNVEVIMLSVKNRIRLIRVGEEARLLKNIEFSGSLLSCRRGAFACVADHKSYALLDVDHQQKIPLFPISSVGEGFESTVGGQIEDISGPSGGIPSEGQSGHGRSTSLGALVSGIGRRQPSPRAQSVDQTGLEEPGALLREGSPDPTKLSADTGISRSTETTPQRPRANTFQAPALKPHILSPTPQEFFLTTGSLPSEPGVGMFVNLDGDVSRSTIEFDKYPKVVIADGRGDEDQQDDMTDEEGYILAVIAGEDSNESDQILVQRWDVDTAVQPKTRRWISLAQIRSAASKDDEKKAMSLSLASIKTRSEVFVDEVRQRLQLKRFTVPKTPASAYSTDSRTAASLERVAREKDLFESQSESPREDDDAARLKEESQFASRFSKALSKTVIWSGSQIWWCVRTPLTLRLDASLKLAKSLHGQNPAFEEIDHRKVIEVLNSVKGREAQTEAELFSLQYVRHKAALLLLFKFLASFVVSPKRVVSNAEKTIVRESLIESGLDPRIALAMIPLLREEVVEGKNGLWIFGGVQEIAEQYLQSTNESIVPYSLDILDLFKHYLSAWRSKKGFGSIANEKEVALTVDTALLLVLLELDSHRKQNRSVSEARSLLYALVDQGVDGFERAVELLEKYDRLYVLSRLYQSRKLARDVLKTWKRILEKGSDEDGEFIDGELEMRKYLGRIRDEQLFKEYGSWLANRNSKLGIQVFSDLQSRVQIKPADVVELLRQNAPATTQDYLEHLVFEQNHAEYVNELIAFYLDSVTSVLEKDESAKSTLSQSYSTYRALRAPKPTYQTFITENALDKPWWHHRLRLLQLLGGSHPSATGYDVATILSRLEPFEEQLVPEMIILDGRQSRHPQALRLLVHGLGDFDTAINYCLLGGSSIVPPLRGEKRIEVPSREEQSVLFTLLLKEFLSVEDITERLEQSGALLERFGGWFDLDQVIEMVPDTWSVAIFSGFLVSALRRLVHERSETLIAKSLSGAENLGVSSDLIARVEQAGPKIEAAE